MRRMILSEGTTAQLRCVTNECVARMPSMLQEEPSDSVVPSERSSIAYINSVPSAVLPNVPKRVHMGDNVVKILVPVNLNDPSPSSSARVSESNSTASLPASEMPNA